MTVSQMISLLRKDLKTSGGMVMSEMQQRLATIEMLADIEERKWNELEGTLNMEYGKAKHKLDLFYELYPTSKEMIDKQFVELQELRRKLFEIEKMQERIYHFRHCTT